MRLCDSYRVRLEDLVRGSTVRGILPDRHVVIVDVTRYSDDAIELVYKDACGNLGNELVLRDREADLELVTSG